MRARRGRATKIVAAVRHLTKKPLRYLVNTSADPDNVGGNAAIVKAAGGTSGPAQTAAAPPTAAFW